MTEPVPPDSRDADSVFEEYLRQRDAGEQVDFEALCRAHPDLAATLRKHEATHTLLDRLLPPPLQEERGEPAGADTTRELLGRLRRRTSSEGRYRLISEIGRGGMGVVQEVLDTELQRTLARKVVRQASDGDGTCLLDDSNTLARFLAEAQITSQLDHPGIVPLHEIGLDAEGRAFFTMRLVRGITLREVFDLVAKRDAEWSLKRAVGVLLKVCEAMSYAHGKNVVHRDLKPANVMVGEFGEVYVMDWGLARVLGHHDPHDARLRPASSDNRTIHTDRDAARSATAGSPLLTRDGHVIGTPAYMSPEQARGDIDAIGTQSDIYATGAMLYHLLAGEMPYVPAGTTNSSDTVRERVAAGPPRRLSEFDHRIPASLIAVCEKAMQRVPWDRYRDMRAMANDLRAYVEGRPVSAYESGAIAEIRMWVRRNKAFAATAAVALLAVLVGGGIWMRTQERVQIQDWLLKTRTVAEAHADLQHSRAKEWTTQGAWCEQARQLVGRIQEVQTRLEALRRTPPTEADFAKARRRLTSDELRSKRLEVQWRERMLGRQPPPSEATIQEILKRRVRSVTAEAEIRRLNGEAFSLVRADHGRWHGNEALAVRLSSFAIEKAMELKCYRPTMRDTLAIACCRVGDFDGGIAKQREAIAETEDLVRSLNSISKPHRPAWLKCVERLRKQLKDDRQMLEDNLEVLQGLRNQWSDRAAQERIVQRLQDDLVDLERVVEADAWSIAIEAEGDRSERHQELVSLLAALRRLERRLRESDEAKRRLGWEQSWQKAIAAIRDNPAYPKDMVLVPQEELLPLRMNPQSTLWEFAHLPSGEPAEAEGDTYRIEPYTGMVMVLLPGGKIPKPPGASLPIHSIVLAPFFLSKFEMTDHQWMRLSGRWRIESTIDSAMRVFSARGITWEQANAALRNAGGWLHLPTGAQWEYAFRANRPGDDWRTDPAFLAECVLLQESGKRGTSRRADGPPNGFGLHDMIGLASEWCADGPDDRATPREGDGLRDAISSRRWLRGGSFNTPAKEVPVGYLAKSARNDWSIAFSHVDQDEDDDWDFFGEGEVQAHHEDAGLRPARPVLP